MRYDKRTRVYPRQFTGSFTVKEEVIDDVLSAISLLRQNPQINSEKIYVLGHSLGGMLIPRIGTLDPHLAGLIIMAGPTRPFEDLFLQQTLYLAGLGGPISPQIQTKLDEIRQQVTKIKDPQLASAPTTEKLLGVPVSYWLDLRGYQPVQVAQQLKQPLLILQGERDYQVTLEDFKGWQQSLSGQPNVMFKSYPPLNHLFIPGTGKSTPAEYQSPGHIDESVINTLVSWIH